MPNGGERVRVLAQRYELVETVGRGGMGEVWSATDRELARRVAVKVLPPELTRYEEFRNRFRREARTVASLSHRGIAVLHDVGEDTESGEEGETTPFLVMEFIEGRTLAQLLSDGPFAVERALAVVRDITDALAHSHGRGLVHRDIKPSNVMLSSDGDVKILDFGIAKVIAETSTRLTVTGMAVGTPAYLSPEQLEGRLVDGRSDVYSTGCLLYELLTGRPPFIGDSPFAVMNQHLSKEPLSPSLLRPQIPAQVDALVLRALAKGYEQRYASAAEMRLALTEALERRPAAARTAAIGPVQTDTDTETAPTEAQAQAPTRTAVPLARVSPETVLPVPPAYAPNAAIAGAGTGSAGATPTTADTVVAGVAPATAKRRWSVPYDRVVGAFGILASGFAALAIAEPAYAVAWVAATVLGLGACRWLPLTSALLWWGAGGLVFAGIEAGGRGEGYDYTSVSESDFDSTLYSYNPDDGSYTELPEDSYGDSVFEKNYDDTYSSASGETSYYYDEYAGHEALGLPVLLLAVLCLARALHPRHRSVVGGVCGLTLAGLGIGWLAFDTAPQTAVYSVAWGLVIAGSSVTEVRQRRSLRWRRADARP
ncbi:serine/threonine-protein kinase [Streptomyces sp. SCSIO 30461]|uniref:serine/threonine-protein kinase n=1 Tax=Streptomyces sp. SCSIO 30461 TaxID=3118085 RepID=UPI0030CFB657